MRTGYQGTGVSTNKGEVESNTSIKLEFARGAFLVTFTGVLGYGLIYLATIL